MARAKGKVRAEGLGSETVAVAEGVMVDEGVEAEREKVATFWAEAREVDDAHRVCSKVCRGIDRPSATCSRSCIEPLVVGRCGCRTSLSKQVAHSPRRSPSRGTMSC